MKTYRSKSKLLLIIAIAALAFSVACAVSPGDKEWQAVEARANRLLANGSGGGMAGAAREYRKFAERFPDNRHANDAVERAAKWEKAGRAKMDDEVKAMAEAP